MSDQSWMDLQDAIVELTLFGLPLQHIIELDMISFNSLHGSARRVRARMKEEQAWAMAVCTQGQANDIKKLTKAWLREAQLIPSTDEEEIHKLFGGVRS